jgi:hypothetical protein
VNVHRINFRNSTQQHGDPGEKARIDQAMNKFSDENQKIVDTVSRRVRVGQDPVVTGWQKILIDILKQMKPFMLSGKMVTFRKLQENESEFFKKLLNSVSVPDRVLALYMPPSVRHQMMYENRGNDTQIAIDHDPLTPPDSGVVLATAENDFSVILNALFAHPPTLAAVDIYEQGQLIGGYTYPSIEVCRKSLTELMQTHLT